MKWKHAMLEKTSPLLFLVSVLFIASGDSSADFKEQLAVVRQYAEQYQPGENEINYVLEVPPPQVVKALNFLRRSGTRQHEPYVVLVLLKLYKNHFQHAHQSYELRDDSRRAKNPMLKEYCRLTGVYPLFWEFLPSDHVVEWIEEHPEVLENPALATEMREIKALIETWERSLRQED